MSFSCVSCLVFFLKREFGEIGDCGLGLGWRRFDSFFLKFLVFVSVAFHIVAELANWEDQTEQRGITESQHAFHILEKIRVGNQKNTRPSNINIAHAITFEYPTKHQPCSPANR